MPIDYYPAPFAAAVEATARPFVQGISDYEQRSPRRIALVGDAAFVVRPHTGMGIAEGCGRRDCAAKAPLIGAARRRTPGLEARTSTSGHSHRRNWPRIGCGPLVVVETANLGEADELACRP